MVSSDDICSFCLSNFVDSINVWEACRAMYTYHSKPFVLAEINYQGVNSSSTAQRGLWVLILIEQDLDSPKNGLSFMGYYIWPKLFLNIATFDIN